MNPVRAMRTVLAGTVSAALVTTGVLAGTVTHSASAANRPVVLSQGHIDLFSVDHHDGKARLQVKDDTGAAPVFREPETVTVAVDEVKTHLTVPPSPAYAFLGAEGDDLYVLPQTQQADLPWPGWSTELLTSSLPAGTTLAGGNPVELAVDVSGPGDVITFQNDSFGGVQPGTDFINTRTPEPDVIAIAGSAHVHTNWAFTELGSYELTVTPTIATSAGALTGPASSYHFQVGPATVDPGPGPVDPVPTQGVTVTPDRENARYLYGQGITLNAAPTQPTELDHWHWFVKREGATDFVISNRSATSQLKLPTSLDWDGAQVYASLYDDNHEVVASSDPLTLSVTALPEVTELTATADRASYRAGDVASFTSAQDPATGEDHFHWYLRKVGEEFYTYIPESNQATATLPITADMDGGTVIARLFDEQHAVIAESGPVELDVRSGADATTTGLELGATEQAYGAAPVDATVTVADTVEGKPAAGTVDITVGGETVADDVAVDAAGTATVALPRDLEPGAHEVVASFVPTDAERHAASTSAAVELTVTRAATDTSASLVRTKIKPARQGVVKVHVSSDVTPSGTVVVRAGKRELGTVELNERGRARVKLPKLRPGKHRLVVVYAGSDHHARSTDRVTLRVRR